MRTNTKITNNSAKRYSSLITPIKANDVAFDTLGNTQENEKPKTYRHSINTYLKDSNSFGNIYFSRHFEWQGICREAWFSECIFENMLLLEGILITKRAFSEYLSDVGPFQTITGFLNVGTAKKASLDLHFSFVDSKTNKLISKGFQTVAFATKNHKITKLPKEILEKALAFQLPEFQKRK